MTSATSNLNEVSPRAGKRAGERAGERAGGMKPELLTRLSGSDSPLSATVPLSTVTPVPKATDPVSLGVQKYSQPTNSNQKSRQVLNEMNKIQY